MDKYNCPWCYGNNARPTEKQERKCLILQCSDCGRISYQPPTIPKEKWDEFFRQQQPLAVQAQ